MAYHAIIRDSDQFMVGTAGPDAVATVAAGHTLRVITKIDFDSYTGRGVVSKDGRYRWKVNAQDQIEGVILGSSVPLLKFSIATGEIVGKRRVPWVKADKAGDTFPDVGDISYHKATEQEYADFTTRRRFYGSNKNRWKMVNGVPTEQADTRPLIRFTPTKLEAAVGDPAPTATVEVVDDQGNVRIGVNGTRTLKTRSGKRVDVVITNGVGSLSVGTARERRDVVVASEDNAVFGEELRIDIFGKDV